MEIELSVPRDAYKQLMVECFKCKYEDGRFIATGYLTGDALNRLMDIVSYLDTNHESRKNTYNRLKPDDYDELITTYDIIDAIPKNVDMLFDVFSDCGGDLIITIYPYNRLNPFGISIEYSCGCDVMVTKL